MSRFTETVKKHRTIDTEEVQCYHVGFDINESGKLDWDIKTLGNVLMDEIVDFAFGAHKDKYIKDNSLSESRITSESAGMMYDPVKMSEIGIKSGKAKFLSKGEFGELILFAILKHYWNTTQLLAKLYFRDTPNMAAHGFDAVHIAEINGKKTICLGESKIYDTGDDGVVSLIDDLKKHITNDYLSTEFGIIRRAFSSFQGNISIDPKTENEIQELLKASTLKQYCSSITIPMLCTYEKETLYINHGDENSTGFIEELEGEIKKLGTDFLGKKAKHGLAAHINVIFMVFPIKSKIELITLLHTKILNAYKIYN